MYNITQEELQKIREVEGDVRGAALNTDYQFILRKGGEESLKKIEERIKEMGADLNYSQIDKMTFYPLSLRVLSLLSISQEFGFDKEGIREMGEMAPRTSFLIKFFAKYFMSVEKTLTKVSDIWEKHYTVGEMEAVKVDEENKEAVFRLHNLNVHPILCDYLSGYLSSVVSMVIGEKANGKEVKCSLQGEDYHEYYINWKNNNE